MWIKCPNGVPTIVNDPDHIKRLLSEGGEPLPDPVEETPVVTEVPLPLIQDGSKKSGRNRG